ncbi:MAG: hypothetical protein RLZ33_1081 [Bacteroidota bacterium]|jgi:hypothetical protein
MLKKSIIVLFAVIICFQAVIQTLIMIDWKVNQDFITARYCVNKNKPELKCNGQCQLAKKLRKVENEINLLDSKGKNQSKKEFKTKQAEFTLLKPEFPSISNDGYYITKSTNYYYSDHYDFDINQTIDHPPC